MVDSVIASPAAASDSSASTSLAARDRVTLGERTPAQDAHARRISYFMLFRLVVLSAFTILAALSSWYRSAELESFYEWVTWGTLGVGYFLTLLFAWTLPRIQNLSAFAWGQTAIDIVLAAVVVQLSGGVDSGFVFLYLVAILGAATMGDRQQTWAATGACFLIYGTTTVLQATGVIETMTAGGPVVRLTAQEVVLSTVRTSAGIAGVGILSAYLNVQLWSSVQQVGSLRALNENIVRSLSSGLLTVDADGRVLFANPTARALIGLSGEIQGKPVDDLIPGAARHLEDSGEGNNRFELELRRTDGRTIQLGLNCAPLLDTDGRFLGHVLHFQDVTELHDLARKARRNERLAAIGGLAASVAHEVRNPLAAISGSAELLQSAVETDDDRKLLDVITRESNRLEKTVSDLLAFTRPRKPEPMPVELVSAVREILDAFGADPANEQLRLSLRGAKSIRCELDPSQFSQVVWNLLRNAAEATEQRGGIEVRLTEEANEVVLTIKDDGPGVPPEQLDRVFEPFFSTKEKGSGFGLALVHRIVQDHGGEASVSNEDGGGACFTIRLPKSRG